MDLIKFQFDGQTINEITIDGNPWFVARDICEVLELGNTSQALSRLDEDEKDIISNDTPGGKQDISIINESGLYSLVLSSRKKNARAFKKWVTSEVLPQIRKTGGYAIPKDPLELVELALNTAKAERARADRLQLQNAEMAPKVELLKNNLESQELVTINKIAVDLNMSAIALNLFLKENAIIYKQGKNWLPYSDWRDCGLFKMDKYVQVVNETPHTREHLKATQKGRLFILELHKSGDSPQEVYKNLREQLTFNLK